FVSDQSNRYSRLFLVIGLVAIMLANSDAQQPRYSPTPPIVNIPPDAAVRKAKVLVLRSPRIEYPAYARERHWIGVGWYLMHVDKKSGAVTSVKILQSAGHKILDKAATDAFSRWQFKPGTVEKVKTPVTWTQDMPPYRANKS